MRHIDKIIVHCAATRPSMDIDAETIRDWHVNDNGWSDIGYHYVIKRDGTIENGRPVSIAGAHARGHNADSIGICLVGGMKEDMSAADANFTLAQYNALHTLVEKIKQDFEIVEVTGHRDLADVTKPCPTFNTEALLSIT